MRKDKVAVDPLMRFRTSIGGMSNRYVVIEGGGYLTDIRNPSRNPTAVPRRCESRRPALGAPTARRYAIPNAVYGGLLYRHFVP
ncbi:hypothetical protein Q8A67_003356 [Cirrhinus molitorella]|uniref:Uncharacterized protein n=1 Tax=Cirrhinus molitorella TaxID=172907 RepID=A0AA88U4H1_9TELE|nr:hypothetical protein Q8A67_003356 [Cirrhinus molitorella]